MIKSNAGGVVAGVAYLQVGVLDWPVHLFVCVPVRSVLTTAHSVLAITVLIGAASPGQAIVNNLLPKPLLTLTQSLVL